MFQSTPPCGGRRCESLTQHPDARFQSTPPCGGRRPASCRRIAFSPFQSTPPCGGRHGVDKFVHAFDGVSIHAPVRGATVASRLRYHSATSFNPRPRAGGDTGTQVCGLFPFLFQSTPPCGGRRQQVKIDRDPETFQSTPPCGGRQGKRVILLRESKFQSTPPCGGRHKALTGEDWQEVFQSTPPCGGRRCCRERAEGERPVSIHAPVRGATFLFPAALTG